MVGLALGTMYAGVLARPALNGPAAVIAAPGWLLSISIAVASVFLILRYSPIDQWMRPEVYGWLIDKWHLGPARVINFTALLIVLTRFGSRIAALPFMTPLAALGQASIEVFSVHVLCCLAGNALSRDPDPNLPIVQQLALLTITLSLLFLTAQVMKRRREKRLAAMAV
jgi:hypothetical protein